MSSGLLGEKKNQDLILVLLLLMDLAVFALVYMTGGTAKVYTHLMYLPIVIASSVFGKKKGLIIAAFGSLLLGPFLPQNVQEHIMQQPINWLIRMSIFCTVALIIGYFSDYDRKNRKKITELLTHSEKTGLKNIEAIKNEEAMDDRAKIIIVFSVKGFQDTMSLFGYFFENKMMIEIAALVGEIVGRYKDADLYQYYGTQFVLKIPRVDEISWQTKTEELLSELRALDKSIMKVDNIPIYLEVRIGKAQIDESVPTYEGIRQAQIAYNYTQAAEFKEAVFDHELEEYFLNIQSIAGGFSEAISNQKIGVAYQNIVSAAEEQRYCIELLARWKKEDGSVISPDLFIPIIEKTELIQELTKYMITRAICFLRDNGEQVWTVSINFSKRDFDNESIDFLLDSIRTSGVDPSRIQVEMIERNLADISNLSVHLDRLRSHHIKLALDDFGTDYSSYQYLSELRWDTIKLDKTLIYNLHESETSRLLVKSIVGFCKECRIATVAEGVATKEIADACKEIGIDYLQGYYYHIPEMADTNFIQ